VVDPGHHYLRGRLFGNRFLAVEVWLAADPEHQELRPQLLLVDTASDRTVLRREELADMGLKPKPERMSPEVDLFGIPRGADLYEIGAGMLGLFSFERWSALGVDSLINYLPTDMEVDGILGMEWLVFHFRRILLVIDEDPPRLELHERQEEPATS
jgi:hypothetical protein